MSPCELRSVSPISVTAGETQRGEGTTGQCGNRAPTRASAQCTPDVAPPPAKLPMVTAQPKGRTVRNKAVRSPRGAGAGLYPLAASSSASVPQAPAQHSRSRLGSQHPQRGVWRSSVRRAQGAGLEGGGAAREVLLRPGPGEPSECHSLRQALFGHQAGTSPTGPGGLPAVQVHLPGIRSGHTGPNR